jgi:hypothetical protein
MHYVTRRSHHMQKDKFGVTCPNTLFMETTPGPLENAKLCINVSHLGCTRMHYEAHRSDRMQKSKVGITCPDALLLAQCHRAHPSMNNSASTFCALEAPECTTCPAEPTGCKNASST